MHPTELTALAESAGAPTSPAGVPKKPYAIKAKVKIAGILDGMAVGESVTIYNIGGYDLAWFVCGEGVNLALPQAAFEAVGWGY